MQQPINYFFQFGSSPNPSTPITHIFYHHRLGRVCKLWHSVSCKPQLWRNVDLAQYTSEKCKTDFKLVWLLENRLSRCHTLNICEYQLVPTSFVTA